MLIHRAGISQKQLDGIQHTHSLSIQDSQKTAPTLHKHNTFHSQPYKNYSITESAHCTLSFKVFLVEESNFQEIGLITVIFKQIEG